MEDVLVRTEEDFERLPEKGFWEVADGRAILLPANDIYPHQEVAGALFIELRSKLKALGYGFVFQNVNVSVPPPRPHLTEIQNRVPDLVVSKQRPEKKFQLGQPPELVIEILATRRGNVERTEKLDEYASAGIGEYWIVNPFDRAVEAYLLREHEYVLRETATTGRLRLEAFPGLEISLQEIWAVLES